MNEIRLDKTNVKRLKGKRPKKALLLEIETIPQKRNVEVKDDLIQIDDKCYILDYFDFKGDLFYAIGLIIFSSIMHFGVGGSFTKGPFIVSIPILLFGCYFIIKPLLLRNRKLVLDRIQGLFSYPNYWSNKPAILNFKEAIFVFVYKGKMAAPTLVAPYTNVKFGGFSLSISNVKKKLSFYVWYMDKNRPLPPGTAFDPYRQKDFERRKAAGFPPPLYYSCGILTPEATPEQQAEREQYWKDQEYFAPQIDRPKHSEIFNTRTHTDWVLSRFEADGHLMANTWHEFTFDNGIIVYMLTNENGEGYLPPKDQNVKVASLKLKERWY